MRLRLTKWLTNRLTIWLSSCKASLDCFTVVEIADAVVHYKWLVTDIQDLKTYFLTLFSKIWDFLKCKVCSGAVSFVLSIISSSSFSVQYYRTAWVCRGTRMANYTVDSNAARVIEMAVLQSGTIKCKSPVRSPSPIYQILQARCPSCHPTNNIKHWRHWKQIVILTGTWLGELATGILRYIYND